MSMSNTELAFGYFRVTKKQAIHSACPGFSIYIGRYLLIAKLQVPTLESVNRKSITSILLEH